MNFVHSYIYTKKIHLFILFLKFEVHTLVKMKEESFFITLMSNSSTKIYSDNKTSSFTVLLPQKVTLNGKWVVALAEIHYNYNFFNITEGNNKIYMKIFAHAAKNIENENTIVKQMCKVYSILPGYYSNMGDIIKIINETVTDVTGENKEILSFNKLNNRTNICVDDLNSKIAEISFSERLSMQLGFAPGDNIMHLRVSPYCANINLGIPDQMLIYTDIIEPSYVGHEMAYILKIVNTQPKSLTFGDACYKEFHKMHYTPVQKREFESISVDIRDYSGKFMPFLHGVLTVKLHFKKQDG